MPSSPFEDTDAFPSTWVPTPQHTPWGSWFGIFLRTKTLRTRGLYSSYFWHSLSAELLKCTLLSFALLWKLFSPYRRCSLLVFLGGIARQNSRAWTGRKACYFHAISNMPSTFCADVLTPRVNPCQKLDMACEKRLWCLFLLPSQLPSCDRKGCLLISNMSG